MFWTKFARFFKRKVELNKLKWSLRACDWFCEEFKNWVDRIYFKMKFEQWRRLSSSSYCVRSPCTRARKKEIRSDLNWKWRSTQNITEEGRSSYDGDDEYWWQWWSVVRRGGSGRFRSPPTVVLRPSSLGNRLVMVSKVAQHDRSTGGGGDLRR